MSTPTSTRQTAGHRHKRSHAARKTAKQILSLHPDVQATLATNPDHYSPITSKSRISSFRYALAGWLWMLKTQKNVRIQSVASLVVLIVGLWLRLDALTWAILVLAITINWMAEFVNAAVESAINLASPNVHPVARVGKDVAAAAVLLTAVSASIIGGLLMGPPLLERLSIIFGPAIGAALHR
jgi:diacylglycerol kinase